MWQGELSRGWPPDHHDVSRQWKRQQVDCVRWGVDTPDWEALSAGLRPEEGRRVRHRERDPTEPRHGWQKVASMKVHKQHREEVVWAPSIFFTKGVGEVTEWTFGFCPFHVFPNMSSDKEWNQRLSGYSF